MNRNFLSGNDVEIDQDNGADDKTMQAEGGFWPELREEVFDPVFLVKTAVGAAVGVTALGILGSLFNGRR